LRLGFSQVNKLEDTVKLKGRIGTCFEQYGIPLVKEASQRERTESKLGGEEWVYGEMSLEEFNLMLQVRMAQKNWLDNGIFHYARHLLAARISYCAPYEALKPQQNPLSFRSVAGVYSATCPKVKTACSGTSGAGSVSSALRRGASTRSPSAGGGRASGPSCRWGIK
jgi:hypothetical protein